MASAKQSKRVNVPNDLAERLLFEADHTCCKCRLRDVDVIIHHIDSPADISPENLMVLCLRCHGVAHRKSNLARNFSPLELKKYRESWIRHVLVKRKAGMHLDGQFKTLAELEVRRLSYTFESLDPSDAADSKEALKLVWVARCFARDFGPEVQGECLSLAYDAVTWIDREAASDLFVSYLCSLIGEVFPWSIPSIRGKPRKRHLKTTCSKLALRAIEMAGEVGYAICKCPRPTNLIESVAELYYAQLSFCLRHSLLDQQNLVRHRVAECIRVSGNKQSIIDRLQQTIALAEENHQFSLR